MSGDSRSKGVIHDPHRASFQPQVARTLPLTVCPSTTCSPWMVPLLWHLWDAHSLRRAACHQACTQGLLLLCDIQDPPVPLRVFIASRRLLMVSWHFPSICSSFLSAACPAKADRLRTTFLRIRRAGSWCSEGFQDPLRPPQPRGVSSNNEESLQAGPSPHELADET